MATRFVKQATQQLNPVYSQQAKAIKSQIPAIQQLYETLNQGLTGQFNTQLQAGLEDAGARGLTRSSIPNDTRTALSGQLLQSQGQLGAQQAKEVAGINTQLGDLRLQKAQGVQTLADALFNRDLKKREFNWQKQMDERELQMQQALAASSGGGSAKYSINDDFASAYNDLLRWDGPYVGIGDDNKANPAAYNAVRQNWIRSGNKASDFDKQFSYLVNESHGKDYAGYRSK